MSRRSVLALVLLLLVATVSLLGAQAPDATALRIVATFEHDLVSGPAGTGAYLSPDGTRFVHIAFRADFDGVCLYETFGGQIGCIPYPKERLRVNQESVVWSPDGQYIAFHDGEPIRLLTDADLWLIDTAENTITNLTDDGTDEGLFEALLGGDRVPDAPADVLPRFSDDSRTLYFLRYEGLNDRFAASLQRISVDGGTVEHVAQLAMDTAEDGFPTLWDLAPGEETAVYSLYQDASEYLYALDMNSGESRLLHSISPDDSEVGYIAVEFSPRGDAVLWHSANAFRYIAGRAGDDTVYVHITRLDGTTFPATLDSHVLYAGWSPDGSALLYSVTNAEDDADVGLYIGAPGEAGEIILTADEESRYFSSPRMPVGLYWGANNALLFTQFGGLPMTAAQLE